MIEGQNTPIIKVSLMFETIGISLQNLYKRCVTCLIHSKSGDMFYSIKIMIILNSKQWWIESYINYVHIKVYYDFKKQTKLD